MKIKFRHFLKYFLIITLILSSCKSVPVETSSFESYDEGRHHAGGETGSLANEITSLIETGVLSSLTQAHGLIQSRDLGGADFGRMMNGIITLIVRLVYPDALLRLPSLDLPLTFGYTRIIREAERGNYTHPPPDSTDFFEHILPFFAINNDTPDTVLTAALGDLSKAGGLKPNSVLPPYFRGLIYERMGQLTNADTAYRQAYRISSEFYPGLAGSARIMRLSGRYQEAVALFSDLVVRYPDSLDLKKELAITHYQNRDWARTGPIVDEVLRSEPQNGDFLLMRAHILVEQGNFSQANATLDTYASINPNNRTYLFLRVRVQAEGNRNRDSALNYLRSMLRLFPNDEEALIYAARLLMESQRAADQDEARELLGRLRQLSGSSIEVLSLSLRDAIQRGSWQEAQGYLNRILATRRTNQDLVDAYTIERGLRNNARALTFARELYERDTSNNEYIAIYVSSLIDNGRRDEASRLIENRLNALSNGPVRSQFFFLRSRIQTDENAAMADLRSSLFEDPRNLDALIATFEIHHRRREERRAVHFLRQALAISPNDPRLRQYEREYSSLLGR